MAIPAVSLTASGTTLQLTPTDDRPFFDEITRSVVVPLASDQDEFRFAAVRSTVWRIDGAARIARSGWALSVATLDPNALGEADNAGTAWIELDTPLALEWKGLPQPVKAPKTVLSRRAGEDARLVHAQPGGRPLRAPALERSRRQPAAAIDPRVRKPRRLGRRPHQPAGSGCGDLQRPRHRPFRSAARRRRRTARDPHADRLVRGRRAGDRHHRRRHRPRSQGADAVRTIAFALENAFIKARSPVWLHLTGPLNAAGIERGLLLLRFPFRFVLPTLPDPYASSIDVPVRTDVDIGWASASVVWPNLDAASLGFNVLPAEAQQGALTTFNTQLVAGRGTAPTVPVLLDVSSNADQFGVAIPPAIAHRLVAAGARACRSSPRRGTSR